MHWTSDLKLGGLTPSPCHYVVSFVKKLSTTLSLSTQVYKWVPATYCWGNPAMDLHLIQGGVAILSVTSCYRNWVKLRLVWAFSSCATTFFCFLPWLAYFSFLPTRERDKVDSVLLLFNLTVMMTSA